MEEVGGVKVISVHACPEPQFFLSIYVCVGMCGGDVKYLCINPVSCINLGLYIF